MPNKSILSQLHPFPISFLRQRFRVFVTPLRRNKDSVGLNRFHLEIYQLIISKKDHKKLWFDMSRNNLYVLGRKFLRRFRIAFAIKISERSSVKAGLVAAPLRRDFLWFFVAKYHFFKRSKSLRSLRLCVKKNLF